MESDSGIDNSRRSVGRAIRREVLGDAYVDAQMTEPSPFRAPLQEMILEFCWGNVWAREGLDRKSRSLVNVGLLAGMGRMHELALHVRGALSNGCNVDEIREVLLQVGVYSGIPAALEAFRVAESTITTYEDEQRSTSNRENGAHVSDAHETKRQIDIIEEHK